MTVPMEQRRVSSCIEGNCRSIQDVRNDHLWLRELLRQQNSLCMLLLHSETSTVAATVMAQLQGD